MEAGRALREAALLLAREGQGLPAAAVEGRWSGELDEGGGVRRRIQLVVRVTGGQASGTLTAESGSLGLDVPLRDVAFDKGTLSFVVSQGGASRRFQGRLASDVIEGTLQDAAGGAAGRVTLRLAE